MQYIFKTKAENSYSTINTVHAFPQIKTIIILLLLFLGKYFKEKSFIKRPEQPKT